MPDGSDELFSVVAGFVRVASERAKRYKWVGFRKTDEPREEAGA